MKKVRSIEIREKLDGRAELLAEVNGVKGPGRWLVFSYQPTGLFALKSSTATSSVGKSLLVPTPYSIKMAFIDAAFRIGWSGDLETLVQDFVFVSVRIGVPEYACVTHSISKIRQEPKENGEKASSEKYISAMAYREMVQFSGPIRIAFDLTKMSEKGAGGLVTLAPYIGYMGKRGSFFQYLSVCRISALSSIYTQSLLKPDLKLPNRSHVATLDDFGPEANLNVLNSYIKGKVERNKHRVFEKTIIPLGVRSLGSGFSEYIRSDE
jgi:hypothetical protein